MSAVAEIPAAGAHAAAFARLARSLLFLAAFLLFWVSVSPFHDLADSAAMEPSNASNLLNQIAVSSVALAAMVFVACDGWRQFASLLSAPFVLTLAAIGVSVVLSAHPDLSARRFVLALFIILIASVCLRLPQDRRHFADLLAVGAALVLVVCYGGLLLAPELAAHHAGEVLEPQHAGSWRGLFAHKNQAGGAMVLLIFIGIFIARARSVAAGGAIIAAAAIFLLFTQSKGAIGLLPLALVLSVLFWRVRSTGLRHAIVLGGVGVFSLLTVGSVLLSPVKSLLETFMSDPSYTNRDDIWRFAIEQTMARPFFGHGFDAFWSTPGVVYSGSSIETWAAAATDAHNGYLNIAVTTGFVTLALAIGWLLVQPVRDLEQSQRNGNDPVVGALFVQIWLYCVFYACLESMFFLGGGRGPMWFTLLVAVLGLRMHATRPVVR